MTDSLFHIWKTLEVISETLQCILWVLAVATATYIITRVVDDFIGRK